MTRDIQLHDSEVSAVSHVGGGTSIVFSTAYIHESAGIPGYDHGVIWTQSAVITIERTAPVCTVLDLPIWVLEGSLRIGDKLHEEFIPAGGHLEGDTEFVLTLSKEDGSDGGIFEVKGTGVKIELLGQPSETEVFNECPRRSID